MEGQGHEPPLEGSAADGRELVYWIAKAAQRARRDSNVPETVVAALAGVNPETIKRFERVERFPKELDDIMVAYAHVAGLDDERELYHQGLDMWHESHPSALERVTDAGGPVERAMRNLVEGARRAQQPSHAERGRKISAAQKRRASR